ncbi:tobamovirus multiplication protein 2A-like [Rutidosis leptorrhynchoides]|uniref:tobamovirus multiplication protein 2A-like n=1 Tax=Rutidosis leptorrhynchoides TaxID=125765 RepID=UPI003A990644
MGCKGCFEWLLKLLNFLITLVGLAMVGYGIYLYVEYKRAADDTLTLLSPVTGDTVDLGRPMLIAVSLSSSFLDHLPKAWFIYLFLALGVILFIISLIGCIASCTRTGCCLVFYSILVVLMICVELAFCGYIYFDKSWKEKIPTDDTGDFHMIYDCLREHWDIVRWVALVCLILEVLIFILALVVRAANKPPEYDSDDELIVPRQQIRQPLINRLPPATGVPISGNADQRGGRTDPWSTRMREKYGLDTSEFTYNPSESQRYQQVQTQPTEEKGRCTIM